MGLPFIGYRMCDFVRLGPQQRHRDGKTDTLRFLLRKGRKAKKDGSLSVKPVMPTL